MMERFLYSKWSIVLFIIALVALFLLALFVAVDWGGSVSAYDSRDLRSHPQGQVGIIRAGWTARPDLLVDVWINPQFGEDGRPTRGPSFVIPWGGSYEWLAGQFGEVRIYAEAWVWIIVSRFPLRVVTARTCQPVMAQISPGRKYLAGGYDWEVIIFGTEEQRDGVVCLTALSR